MDSQASPPKSRIRETASSTLFVVYLVLVLVITMRPRPITEGASKPVIDSLLDATREAAAPEAFGFGALQFLANILMFVPLGFLLTLMVGRNRAWLAIAGLFLLTAAIEIVQHFFLPRRFGDIWDVVANTAGALFGVIFAVCLWWLVDLRDRRLIARTLHCEANREPR